MVKGTRPCPCVCKRVNDIALRGHSSDFNTLAAQLIYCCFSNVLGHCEWCWKRGTIASRWIGHKEWVSLLNSSFRMMLSARTLIKELKQTYCMCTHSLSVPGSLFGSFWSFVCKKAFCSSVLFVGALFVAIYCVFKVKRKEEKHIHEDTLKSDGVFLRYQDIKMDFPIMHYKKNKQQIFNLFKIKTKIKLFMFFPVLGLNWSTGWTYRMIDL